MSSTGKWVGVQELAAELGVPVGTIYSWRSRSRGPRAATFGKHLRFSRSDIDAWIAGQMDSVVDM